MCINNKLLLWKGNKQREQPRDIPLSLQYDCHHIDYNMSFITPPLREVHPAQGATCSVSDHFQLQVWEEIRLQNVIGIHCWRSWKWNLKTQYFYCVEIWNWFMHPQYCLVHFMYVVEHLMEHVKFGLLNRCALALFPGLPRCCSSTSVYYTATQTEEKKKTGETWERG